jgi:sec-independent protein translocase protein TatA
MTPLIGFGGFDSPIHWILLIGIGVLLFGKRLPEVGRSLGKGIVEFKKGLKGLEDEVEGTTTANRQDPAALEPPRPPQRVTSTAPKFEDNSANVPTPPQS